MTSSDDTPRDRPRRGDERPDDTTHRTSGDSPGVDHSGKGPRGWRRSDDRICEDVNVALYRDPNIDAGDIEVRVLDGEVTLTGTVADKFARRMAEDIADSVFGVTDVQNLLRVKRDGEGAEASSGRAPDREVKRTAEREGATETPAPAVVRHKKPPSSPESLAD
jgi:hypothetical protein